jgi:hypothetical protein
MKRIFPKIVFGDLFSFLGNVFGKRFWENQKRRKPVISRLPGLYENPQK